MTWTPWSPDPSGPWSSLAYSTICRWFGHRIVTVDKHEECLRCGALRFRKNTMQDEVSIVDTLLEQGLIQETAVTARPGGGHRLGSATVVVRHRPGVSMAVLRRAAELPNLIDDVALFRQKFGSHMDANQGVALCNMVAWKNRAASWGLNFKSSGAHGIRSDGARCAIDILHHRDSNIIVDCLIASEGPSTPGWIVHGENTNPTRPWVAAIDSGIVDPGVPHPPPLPPPTPVLPGRERAMNFGKRIDAYYASQEGLQRRPIHVVDANNHEHVYGGGMSIDGRPDWEGIGTWLQERWLVQAVTGKSDDEIFAVIVREIRQSEEWLAKHPGETP